jgi:hypothetical protein
VTAASKSAGGVSAVSGGGFGVGDSNASAYNSARQKFAAADGDVSKFDEMVRDLGGAEVEN